MQASSTVTTACRSEQLVVRAYFQPLILLNGASHVGVSGSVAYGQRRAACGFLPLAGFARVAPALFVDS
jgi:hypothetical protein